MTHDRVLDDPTNDGNADRIAERKEFIGSRANSAEVRSRVRKIDPLQPGCLDAKDRSNVHRAIVDLKDELRG